MESRRSAPGPEAQRIANPLFDGLSYEEIAKLSGLDPSGRFPPPPPSTLATHSRKTRVCSNLGDDGHPTWLDLDIFVFDGTAGEEVDVRMDAVDPSQNGERAILILADKEENARLFRRDQQGLPNHVSARLPVSGRYLIIVRERFTWIGHHVGFRGPYCLAVSSSGDGAATLRATDWVESVQYPPMAFAGEDQRVADVDGDGRESVLLKGDESHDPDGTIEHYLWTEDGEELATTANPTLELPLGQHAIKLKVTDNDGLMDSDVVIVIVSRDCVTGADCNDHNLCTDEFCREGRCIVEDRSHRCTDRNPCTEDRCDPEQGCAFAPVEDGRPCGNDNLCDGVETCQAGTCTGGDPLNCDDRNSCTVDSCHPAAGCRSIPRPGGCDDEDPCTTDDHCELGACVGRPVPECGTCQGDADCDDGNPCTTDQCGTGGACVNDPVGNGTSCDDGTVCNGLETCQAGQCAAGTSPNCDDGNPCTTDSCDAVHGCVHDGTGVVISCTDGNACTANDACQGDAAGTCVGSPVSCDDGNGCTDDHCDPATGCENPPNSASCDDGDACTAGDVCLGGTCSGTPLPCDDGEFCTGVESCVGGDCVSSGNPCPKGQMCDEANDRCAGCLNDPDCDDGNPCTSELCVMGFCQVDVIAGCCLTDFECDDGDACTDDQCGMDHACAYAPVACDDGDACTLDSCDPALGCVVAPVSCDDGNACTEDTCDPVSGCQYADVSCPDDGNPCHDQVCDQTAGCMSVNNTDPCDDQDGCTGGDTCQGGVCAGTPIACDDGVFCNGTESCVSGQCVSSGSPCPPPLQCDETNRVCLGCLGDGDCDDSNPCTTDTCDSGTGQCSFTPIANCCVTEADCEDGDLCTDDVCDSGNQCSFPDISGQCDDGHACTTDSCDPAMGCANVPVVCDDGVFCTGVESCDPASGCQPGADPCPNQLCDSINDRCVDCLSDADCGGVARNRSEWTQTLAGAAVGTCLVPTCDVANGICIDQPLPDGTGCDDGLFCTINDQCTGGVCGGDPMDCGSLNDQCGTGTCSEATDQCVRQPGNEGLPCDDGAFCSENEFCMGGVCGFGTAFNCGFLDDDCNLGVCDDTLNDCVAQPTNEGGPCNDGDFCTVGEFCTTGTCGQGGMRDCTFLDDDCNLGVCDSGVGDCILFPVNEGGPCDDGLFCTVTDACSSGTCVGTGDPCQPGETCSEGSDSCAAMLQDLMLVPDFSLVGVGRSIGGSVVLPSPAPLGGVVVTLGTLHPAFVTLTPGMISIPEGDTEGRFMIDGIGVGVATLTAGAPGFNQDTAFVEVTLRLLALPTTINIPLGQTVSLPVSVSPDPAPVGGVLVTLTSDDPSIANILTPTVTIPEGAFSANGMIEGVSPGTTPITATAPTYAPDFGQASTTAELDIVQTNITFSSALGGFDLTIQLESAGNPVAAPSPVNVDVVSADPACVATESPVVIGQGLISTTSNLTYGGSATLPCMTTIMVSSPGAVSDMVNVTVNPAPPITLFSLPASVGSGLQGPSFLAQLGAAQHGGVTMRIESDDPSLCLISPNAMTAGTAFLDVFLANGSINAFYTIQGVEGVTGACPITASAPGFNSDTDTANIVQPALDISGLLTSIDTLDQDDVFSIRVGIPNGPGTALNQTQPVRVGGSSLTATVMNSNPNVGELVTTALTGQSVTVSIPVGQSASANNLADGVAFSPGNPGMTTVSATIPGLITLPTASTNVNVTAPDVTLFSLPATIGSGLQGPSFLAQLGAAQHGGVTMRIESDDPSLCLISPNAMTAGTAFLDVFLANGSINAFYTIQGVEGVTGACPITASAPGFNSDTDTANIVQPALDISGLLTSIDTLDQDDVFVVRVGIPNGPGTVLNQTQPVRAGGSPLTATIMNSNAAVGELDTNLVTGQTVTVEIAVEQSSSPASVAAGGVAFRPGNPGMTTVSATIPGFLALPTASVNVNVTAPDVTLFSLPASVGSGLQGPSFLAQLGAAQHGGVTMRIESDDPSLCLISPNAMTAGAAFLDVFLANGSVNAFYTIQGVEGVTGACSITASAPGFNSDTDTANIVQPAFDISGLLTSIDTLDQDDVFAVRVGLPNAANTGLNVLQPVRAGGTPLTVDLSNSNAAVGQLVTSTDTGQLVSVQIGTNQSTTPNGAVSFSPLSTGMTTVSASIAGFTVLPSSSVTVTVTTPTIAFFSLPTSVGSGLQSANSFLGQLSASQHGGITVRLESSNPAVCLLAPNISTAGSPFLDFVLPNGTTNFNYFIQGLEGATGGITLTASAPGFLDANGVVNVVTPAVDITSLSANISSGAADDAFNARVGLPNGNNTALALLQPVRAGGPSLTVTFTNADAAVGQLVTMTTTGQMVTAMINAQQSTTPSTVLGGGVAFDPLAAGMTNVVASIPGFTTMNPGGNVAVNVTP